MHLPVMFNCQHLWNTAKPIKFDKLWTDVINNPDFCNGAVIVQLNISGEV